MGCSSFSITVFSLIPWRFFMTVHPCKKKLQPNWICKVILRDQHTFSGVHGIYRKWVQDQNLLHNDKNMNWELEEMHMLWQYYSCANGSTILRLWIQSILKYNYRCYRLPQVEQNIMHLLYTINIGHVPFSWKLPLLRIVYINLQKWQVHAVHLYLYIIIQCGFLSKHHAVYDWCEYFHIYFSVESTLMP